MPIGIDTQYDLSWQELDKVRRRQELKRRLKVEGVRKLYDPYLQMKREVFTDPAVDRYMELRKRGRCPGTPMKPSIFFSIMSTVFVPILTLWYFSESFRRPLEEKWASGEIPYEKRETKAML